MFTKVTLCNSKRGLIFSFKQWEQLFFLLNRTDELDEVCMYVTVSLVGNSLLSEDILRGSKFATQLTIVTC